MLLKRKGIGGRWGRAGFRSQESEGQVSGVRFQVSGREELGERIGNRE
jgi:hypothetical protein